MIIAPEPPSVPPAAAAAPGTGYRSIRGLTAAVVALLSLYVVLMGAATAVMFAALRLQGALPASLESIARADAIARVLKLLGTAGSLARAGIAVWFLTGVIFLVWVHRAYRNLPALGSQSLRLTPGAAVAGWFVPFYNLAHGYLSLRDLYLESQPPPAELPGALLRRRAPLVAWWWCFFLLRTAVDIVLDDLAKSSRQHSSVYLVCSLVTSVVAAVACALMILQIARRQADKNDDLVRRVPVPPPMDRLR